MENTAGFAHDRRLKEDEHGFVLLLVAALLAVAAAFALRLSFTGPPGKRRADDLAALKRADAMLTAFMVAHGRLPCPDSDGDGGEDCGSGEVKGRLPWRTLGLKGRGFGPAGPAILYGLYRYSDTTRVSSENPMKTLYNNAPDTETFPYDADLGVNRNRFEPTTVDDSRFNDDLDNSLDLCVALANADARTFDPYMPYIRSRYQGPMNVAYALAAPGLHDSDGANGVFDGANGMATPEFSPPDHFLDPDYDDQVLVRFPAELYDRMACDTVLRSLDIMADAAHNQQLVTAASTVMKAIVSIGVATSSLTTVGNVIDAISAVIALGSADAAFSASIAALTAAVSSCAVIVGCAEIPVMAGAVAAASLGVASGVSATALSGVAVVSQAVATAAYAGVAAAAFVSLPSTSAADLTATIDQTRQALDQARADLDQARSDAASARNDEQAKSLEVSLRYDLIKAADPDRAVRVRDVFSALDALDQAVADYNDRKKELDTLQQQCDAVVLPGGSAQECADASDAWRQLANQCAAIDPPDPNAQVCQDADAAWDHRQQMCGSGDPSVCDRAAAARDAANQAQATVDARYNDEQQAEATALDGLDPSSTMYGLVNDAISAYKDKLQARHKAETADRKVAELEKKVDSLSTTLASLLCSQDGKNYDAATGACTDRPADGGSSSPMTWASGAENIVKQADALAAGQ